MYCAIIGDIISSKKIEDRWEIQNKLDVLLEEINKKYSEFIASKFTITIGDEFQGLLKNTDALLEILNYIKLELYPVSMRFGVGVGMMTTSINLERAIGSDGPAYHCARRSIELIKEINKKHSKADRNILIEMDNLVDDKIELINLILLNTYNVERNWTDRQREIIRMIENQQLSQKGVAEYLLITQAGVNKQVKLSEYYLYKENIETAQKIINKIWGELNEH